jgi:hypothetical protein
MWCISELFPYNFKNGLPLLIIFWFFPKKVAILFINQVIGGLCESGSERIPRSVLRGKRANGEHNYSLWIEDSPQFTAENLP